MQLMADNFPGVFNGYKLSVVESHQRNKADVSGTAKAVVASMQQMGVEDFKEVGPEGGFDTGGSNYRGHIRNIQGAGQGQDGM